ncbi:MAG: aminopeptidase P family protein [Pseudomonadales bacterium]|nr:aminopeptidase P family protein [Pseudomonadales bacterium]
MPIGYSEQPTGLFDRLYRWAAPKLSRNAHGADELPSAEDIEGFRKAQRLAYNTVTYVANQLRVGVTEKEAAHMLESYLKDHGSERYLHRPFAWFGNHARFDEYQSYDDYHPGDRKLEHGATAILDVAPIVNGFIGDVGYTISLGENRELDLAREFLLELRAEIPRMFMSRMTPAEIWHEVDRRIASAGYDNIHSKYPFCTLGHRVFRVQEKKGSERRLGSRYFGWFSVDANLALLKFGPAVTINAENIGKKIGLWAIEPHIGWSGGGAKFEEILMVEPDRCYWLDDNVPHVQDPISVR